MGTRPAETAVTATSGTWLRPSASEAAAAEVVVFLWCRPLSNEVAAVAGQVVGHGSFLSAVEVASLVGDNSRGHRGGGRSQGSRGYGGRGR